MLKNILFLLFIGATSIRLSNTSFSGMSSPFAMLFSKLSGGGGGQACCKQQYGGGGGGGRGRIVEAFDDGTPLEFYRRQVAMQHGGGGGGGYGGGGYGGGGRGMGRPKPTVPNGPFGPYGPHTSRKWRGFGKAIKNNGGYGGGQEDKLNNVRLVKSENTKADVYNDNTLTMIADTVKGGYGGGGNGGGYGGNGNGGAGYGGGSGNGGGYEGGNGGGNKY